MTYYLKNLIVLSFTTFLAAVSWNQVVPFLPQFLKELGVTRNLAQWSGFVFAMQWTAGIIMQPLWGNLGDKYGRKFMVMRAGFFLSVIYFLMSIATQPWHVAVLRFLNGALTGFIPGSAALIATNTPTEFSARYVAIAQTASAAGGILGPAIGGILAGWLGFRTSLKLSGTFVLLATIVVLLLVEERNKTRAGAKSNIIDDFKIALSNRVMTTLMVVTILSWAINSSIQPILTIYLETLSTSGSKWLAGTVFSLPGIAFLIAGYRWTRLGEKITYQRVIQYGLIGVGLSMIVLAAVGTLLHFSLAYFVMGIFAASLAPCASAVIAVRIDEAFRGRAYGMQQSAGNIGGLLSPIAAGAIGGWLGLRYVFVFVGLVMLAGTVLVRNQMKRWPAPNEVTCDEISK